MYAGYCTEKEGENVCKMRLCVRKFSSCYISVLNPPGVSICIIHVCSLIELNWFAGKGTIH